MDFPQQTLNRVLWDLKEISDQEDFEFDRDIREWRRRWKQNLDQATYEAIVDLMEIAKELVKSRAPLDSLLQGPQPETRKKDLPYWLVFAGAIVVLTGGILKIIEFFFVKKNGE